MTSARIFLTCSLLALGACQAGTPAQTPVAEAEVALTTAERLALHYVTLPACPKATLCSDAATVAKIKAADNVAYAAVKAARANNTDANVAAANAAIAGLLSIIPALMTNN